MAKIKVLIVDDSAVVREVLKSVLEKDSAIEVMATAADPIFAQRYMEKQWPDVIVLDIEMPRMDGITFLKKIMVEHPTPVVICSGLSKEGAAVTMQAIAAGAVDIITKPEMGIKGFLEDSATKFILSIKGAAEAKIGKLKKLVDEERITPETKKPPQKIPTPHLRIAPKLSADAVLPPGKTRKAGVLQETDKIIALGTSTGGTQSLEIVLRSLPKDCPGIVIVQHMPANFTAAFAERLNQVSTIKVKEAADGDSIDRGQAIIAHGDKHMAIVRSGSRYRVNVLEGPLVSRHRPSVDVLFRSMAREAGKNAMGVIMTGMGDDGASGLLEMREAGSKTYAQDEDTCIVYGMPAEAVKKGAAGEIISLYQIAKKILQF